MKPHVTVASITFSDGTAITLEPSDIIVVVGPNNSGKSATLRFIRDRFQNENPPSPVISQATLRKIGTLSDVSEWLPTVSRKETDLTSGLKYVAHGVQVWHQHLEHYWLSQDRGFRELSRFFCHMLTADERLQAANPASGIALTRQAPSHPIHYLMINDSLEISISRRFREAFGVDLIVHRNAGSTIPLMCGDRPEPKEGQDRVSFEYIQELEKLPQLETQGDGMRSFAGVLLHTTVGQESVLLIDEPEAFLHPPQARLLGRMLVRDARVDQQLVVATHSGDILRGMLDEKGDKRLRIIRLQRSGSENVCRELSATDIDAYWSDPLLRYSNILDGIFHEKVILCESDSDNRFYAAVLDSIYEGADTRRPDVMFTHCGGKGRMPTAIRALKRLGVPTVAVADFDVLRDENPLRQIIETLGADWAKFKSDWKLVKNSIESKKAELTSDEVKDEIESVLSAVNGPTFPDSGKKNIQAIFRRSSPWSTAKEVGKAYVPSGDASLALNRLLVALRSIGLFIVEVGELEGFDKSVGNHGPAWVNQVLLKDLGSDPTLASARAFVGDLLR